MVFIQRVCVLGVRQHLLLGHCCIFLARLEATIVTCWCLVCSSGSTVRLQTELCCAPTTLERRPVFWTLQG